MNAHAPFDTELFRKTMGGFATGVTVITVDAAGGPHGMTANAFMSGSLTPPLCVVSIAKRAHTHAMVVAAGRFGVNILGEHQRDLAIYFAGKKSLEMDTRFERVEETQLLRGCAARIAARVENSCDCGDHTLFIGAIRYMDANDSPPLVYHRGAFGGLSGRKLGHTPVPEFW
jgi:flavin reductase (DIM6/NTAB) family NADH-FMN oxidoreductase RutF